MPQLSQSQIERSRNYESLIFQKITSHGQMNIAEALKTSEATVVRLKERVEPITQMLALIGLKVVPVENKCFDPAVIDPYIAIAKQHMKILESSEQLQWND